MSTSLPPEFKEQSGFLCDCQVEMRPVCNRLPFYKEHEGKKYCVLHFPGKEKRTDFEEAFKSKRDNKDLDFRGVWFPGKVLINDFEFKDADFSDAVFSAGADFRSARFPGASFFKAIFAADVSFDGSTFSPSADFQWATFSGNADFSHATFAGLVDFSNTTFSGRADFREVTLKADDESGRISELKFEFARIERPDHVSFHTVTLRPQWFVNVDARKIDFNNVEWEYEGKAKDEITLSRNIASGKPTKEIKPPGIAINARLKIRLQKIISCLKNLRKAKEEKRLLAIACRKLAANAEENDRYTEASDFRRMAMNADRQEKWAGFPFWRLSCWYWMASGYGERALQSVLVLFGIWILFALFYTQVGFVRAGSNVPAPLVEINSLESLTELKTLKKLWPALTYSAGVMILQKPEPRPASPLAQTLVLLETILGPVQGALLALAMRRKFMS